MTIVELLLLTGLAVLSVLTFLSWFFPWKDKKQEQSIQDCYDDLEAQKTLVETLRRDYLATLEDLAEANRISRIQAEVSDRLRQEILNLKEMVGIQPTELLVLGIWPYPDTELSTRIGEIAIYNTGFEYKTLRGEQATKEEISKELQRHSYFLLEVGSHGSKEYINLHGDVARPGWWARLTRFHPSLQGILLLACESDEIGDALVNVKIPFVISVQQKIKDEHAVIFTRNFYEQLARNHDTYQDVATAVDYAKSMIPDNVSHLIRFRATVSLNEPINYSQSRH